MLTRTLNGVVGGDDGQPVGGTATFANKNVGTDKTVTLTGAALAGADAGNYSSELGRDDDREHHGEADHGHFTAANKVYDGNTSATVLTRTLNGVVGRRRGQP